jgi:hypothetical protein
MTANTKAKLIVFLNTLTLIGGAITIILLLHIIGNTTQQNSDTNDKIAASQKATEKELRCLASFFSQSNRQTIRISNLETCVIIHTDTGKTEALPLTPIPVKLQSSPAVPPNVTKQNSTTTSTQTQSNKPKFVSNPASQGQATPTVKRLLGIPLCVPLTGICIR